LAATTREMAAHNRELEQKMEVSSRQMETLQTTLQNVRIESLTDGLTGLANRKHFDETLNARLAEDQVDHAGLCLLLCDIDHFKRVNDTWGHQIGDQVIRYVATVLSAQVEGDFLAARYGGEEFALIMPRTKLAAAAEIAERIRTTIKAKTLSRKSTGEILGRVTISLGIARSSPDDDASTLIGRADARLYQSKRTGRDRVTADASVRPASAA
jgi:diguanylate cyclase